MVMIPQTTHATQETPLKKPWEIDLKTSEEQMIAIKSQLQTGNEIRITPVFFTGFMYPMIVTTPTPTECHRIRPLRITIGENIYRNKASNISIATGDTKKEMIIKIDNTERRILLGTSKQKRMNLGGFRLKTFSFPFSFGTNVTFSN